MPPFAGNRTSLPNFYDQYNGLVAEPFERRLSGGLAPLASGATADLSQCRSVLRTGSERLALHQCSGFCGYTERGRFEVTSWSCCGYDQNSIQRVSRRLSRRGESVIGKLTRTFFVCSLALAAVVQTASAGVEKTAKGYVPPDGFIPTAQTAIAVAEAVLIPVYAKDQIESESPFNAVLDGNVWVVTGSVPCHNPPPRAECPGGAAEIRISKRTGQVLFMAHYE